MFLYFESRYQELVLLCHYRSSIPAPSKNLIFSMSVSICSFSVDCPFTNYISPPLLIYLPPEFHKISEETVSLPVIPTKC